MKKITEEDRDIISQWQEDAKKQTLETLPEFMRHILQDYLHDYGTICRAIAVCAIAAANAANHSAQGGITGFQAGFVMWDFVRQWKYRSNRCGMRLVDYDEMLYPQYEREFDKTISADTMAALVKEAQRCLSEIDEKHPVHPEVKKHWGNIAAGNLPFGYSLRKD